MTNANDIEAQAMEWLVRLEAQGAVTAAEGVDAGGATALRAEFMTWCEADSRRHAAYIRLRSAWRKSDQLRRLATLDSTVDIDLLAPASPGAIFDPQAKTDRKRVRGIRQSMGWRTSLAAALALVVATAAIWLTVGRSGAESYATGVGGFERILLVDGSTVELDTDSRIQVRLTDNHRRIELVRGRANFKVAADARRPFEVKVAETTVRALGTAFSVRLRDSQHVELLVTEGRVTVVESSGREANPPIFSAGEAAIIKPIQFNVQASQVERPEIDRQLSWTQGRLTFDGETLQAAVSEFNRYNPRELVVADPAIAGIKIGGSFQPTDPESFIAALERSFGVKVQSADADEIRLVRAEE